MMKLKLRRDQKSGLTGSITFKLLAIVDLDADEKAAVNKYKLGKEVLYETPKGAAALQLLSSNRALSGITATIAAKATNQILTVNDLVNGKEISCKNINEMLAAEEQIRQACVGLSRILLACEHFEGEEIIEIEPLGVNA